MAKLLYIYLYIMLQKSFQEIFLNLAITEKKTIYLLTLQKCLKVHVLLISVVSKSQLLSFSSGLFYVGFVFFK